MADKGSVSRNPAQFITSTLGQVGPGPNRQPITFEILEGGRVSKQPKKNHKIKTNVTATLAEKKMQTTNGTIKKTHKSKG